MVERCLQQSRLQMMNSGVRTMKCPFDPAHIMPYQRFLNHLEKCQFPDKKLYRKCKFNPYHVIHHNELQDHQSSCPDRKKFEVQDDDWGVEDEQPQQQQLVNQLLQQDRMDIKSHASFNTNSSSQKSDVPKKDKKIVPHNKEKIYKSSSKGQKSIDVHHNSLIQIQDLQTFNAPCSRKYQ